MEKLIRLNEDDRDNFVAYLDSELPEEETRKIERILTQSEVARHEIDLLAKTWELLDTLPRPKASDDFKEKTMATLTIHQMPVPMTEHPWFKKFVFGCFIAGWLASLVVLAGFGYLIAQKAIPNEHAKLLQHYPVIKNFDTYQEIDNIQFLQQLEKNVSWMERPQK
jgi:hypothetical protein